jgi:hypothetical protein
VVARLSRDAHGGSFELFDGKAGVATKELRPNPYREDEEDPGSTGKPARGARPGPGF